MMDASPVAWRRSRFHSINLKPFFGISSVTASPTLRQDLVLQRCQRRGRQRRRWLGSLDAIGDKAGDINFPVGIIGVTPAIPAE